MTSHPAKASQVSYSHRIEKLTYHTSESLHSHPPNHPCDAQ